MKSVLFVDDEANILSGLQRMLRSMRSEWTVEVASSGPEALALLEQRPFDIVVSDMKMPGMDGAELLTKVKQRHPASIRIILSGQADRTAILKSIAPAHQYLSKPCDADALKRTLGRAHALGALLEGDELKQIVSSVAFLPAAPTLHAQLSREFENAAPSLHRIAKIVELDPGMSANTLKLVSSAHFGGGEPTADVVRALNYLGPETVRDLWEVPIFSEYRGLEGPGFSIERLAQDSARVAALARIVAQTSGADERAAAEARQAGTLHGVGRLVLAASIPERYERIARRATGRRSLFEAETEELGADHAAMGAYLLGLWGLPESIVDAVAYQVRPSDCPRRTLGVLTAVHVAQGLGNSSDGPSRLDLAYLKTLGLDRHLPVWRDAWSKHEELTAT